MSVEEENFNALITRPTFDITKEENKKELALVVSSLPQVECPVYHRFGPGIYIREAHFPKGSLIVGHEHLHSHVNVLLKGKIQLIDGNKSPTVLEAPYMFVAEPGRKIGFMLEDVIWQNIYATTETDIEVLEKSLYRSFDEWDAKLESRFQLQHQQCQVDRDDYQQMLKEIGWTEEQVKKVSNIQEDRIPFPEGTYMVTPHKSPIQGMGLFASAPFFKGMTIVPARLEGKRTPGGYLVNHSKDPNAEAIINNKGDIYLVAIKDINGMHGGLLGDEITLDYRQVINVNYIENPWKEC